MAQQIHEVTVRMAEVSGDRWTFPMEPGTQLREFVTSVDFIKVTRLNPNKLSFLVNGQPADDDLILVPGDDVAVVHISEKALISPRDAVKRLACLVGLRFDRHGGRHDHWRTADGRRVDFPRHARGLTPGTLKSILKQAGLQMGIEEFVSSS